MFVTMVSELCKYASPIVTLCVSGRRNGLNPSITETRNLDANCPSQLHPLLTEVESSPGA